jgi:PAS domain S-box-containing protein
MNELEPRAAGRVQDDGFYRRFVERLGLRFFFYRHDLAGVFTYISPSITDVLGYSPAEFEKHYSTYMTDHPLNRETVRYTDLSIQGIPQSPYRLEIRRGDGSVCMLEVEECPIRDDSGHVVAVEGIAQDVTTRHDVEESLKRSEEMLRKIIEFSPISMAIVGMDGTIEYINRCAIETFGYEHADIPVMECWWPRAYPDVDYRAEVIATWTGLVEKALVEQREIEGRDYRVTCKDGTVKEMFIFGVPVANKVFVLFQDVTERERALQAAETAVQVRDEFLLIASHDLKTPLSSLQIQVEGMERAFQEGRLTPDEWGPAIDIIGRQTRRLIRLVRGLLELARINAGRLEIRPGVCDLGNLAREVCRRMAPELAKVGCELELIAGSGVIGSWDGDRIEQVLENLLANAIKFGAGRPIRVEVIAIGSLARMVVADRGVGIENDLLERVFDPFERGGLSSHFGGMGMGLHISREIVRAHGGTLRAASVSGQGAIITMELPLA